MEIVEEALDPPVEYRVQAVPPGLSAWVGDRQVAAVTGREDRLVFAVNVFADGQVDREVSDRILSQVEAMAAGPGVVIDSQGAVLRDEARRRGYTGPLRGMLTVPDRPVPSPSSGEGIDPATLATAVGALVGRTVTVEASAGRRRLLSAVRFGYGRSVKLSVPDPGLTVVVPDNPDVMVEGVARAIDTVVAVRQRFGPHAEHLRTISFDRVSHRPEAATWAGQADDMVFSIHLSDNLVVAGDWIRHRRDRERAGHSGVAMVPHPFGRVDGVAAHEAWHQIDFKFRGRAADLAIFRRELGRALGVETLEQAIQGCHRSAPEPLQAAARLLAGWVSNYATTNPLEATAEMFELWWHGVSNPIIDRFGELLDRFFGVGAVR